MATVATHARATQVHNMQDMDVHVQAVKPKTYDNVMKQAHTYHYPIR